MKKILLLSDTHGCADDHILKYARQADEIWHAGDIGSVRVADTLSSCAVFRAVYGNIDGWDVRSANPERLRITCEGTDVLIKHIGGYPGRYDRSVYEEIFAAPPKLFISGHSHILKVMYDRRHGALHINPGAAGKYGFHKVRTAIRLEVDGSAIGSLEVGEWKK